MDTVDRKIVFYSWSSIDGKPAFDPERTIRVLSERIEQDPSFAVIRKNEVDTAVEVVPPDREAQSVRLQILALRSPNNRPSAWAPGQKIAAIPMSKNHYTADVTHVSIWPDGIAAQDLHGNAPRLGRLSFYIAKKLSGHVSFDPLYRPDMYEKLARMKGQLRAVEFALTRPEYLNQKQSGTFSTLLPAAFGAKVPSVQVRVGMGRYGPKDRYLDEDTEEAVFSIAESADELVDKLIVRGRDPRSGRVEKINFLTERLVSHVTIPRSLSNPALPDAENLFAQMERAYGRFKDEDKFQKAVRAQPKRLR